MCARWAVKFASTVHGYKAWSTFSGAFTVFVGLTACTNIITITVVKPLMILTNQNASAALEYTILWANRNTSVII